ncbi:MAG TPA: radical SAM protein [Rhodocyclaceae bacterium]|nr:radical SAM protein [Rhodocyclaceae bacterium]
MGSNTPSLLDETKHSRDNAGMTYVYPVVSRRAGGVSIGINLNPNNACNWRCVYCQVPDLKRGGPPLIDLELLRSELESLLEQVCRGDFMESRVAPESRRLVDVAFSGNGEPTSAAEFPEAVACVAELLDEFGLAGKLPVRLITNGSLIDRLRVREGLKRLAAAGGEVWFKLDGLTGETFLKVNNTKVSPEAALNRLRLCAEICPTWVQSCFFILDGMSPSAAGLDAYVNGLAQEVGRIRGVHLYGLARPSTQPEAPRLQRLPREWLEGLAGRLKEKGLTVTVSP